MLIPDFLSEEIQQYISSLKDLAEDERIFPITKSYLHHEMRRGCAISGVKKGIRHSHISLLVDISVAVVVIIENHLRNTLESCKPPTTIALE